MDIYFFSLVITKNTEIIFFANVCKRIENRVAFLGQNECTFKIRIDIDKLLSKMLPQQQKNETTYFSTSLPGLHVINLYY